MLNRSPLAVGRPWRPGPYQEALPCWTVAVARPTRLNNAAIEKASAERLASQNRFVTVGSYFCCLTRGPIALKCGRNGACMPHSVFLHRLWRISHIFLRSAQESSPLERAEARLHCQLASGHIVGISRTEQSYGGGICRQGRSGDRDQRHWPWCRAEVGARRCNGSCWRYRREAQCSCDGSRRRTEHSCRQVGRGR